MGGETPPTAYGRTTRWPRDPTRRRLAAKPGVHGCADVGELALVDLAGRVAALDVREEQRVLAGVVRRGRRRVAAVVRCDDEEIARAERVEQVWEPIVEVLETAVEIHGVVPVAPQHVRLDEVHEHE